MMAQARLESAGARANACGVLETPNSLLDLVGEVVAAENAAATTCTFLWAGQAFSTNALLNVLTYCYATGACSSADVQERIREETQLRHLCGSELPDVKVLRRFRRSNRFLLKKCLVHLIELALLLRFGHGEESYLLPDYCVAVALDRWFDPLCVPWPCEEAEERLNRACFIDGMLMID